jgi:N-acetylneuraminic acid mutarotase
LGTGQTCGGGGAGANHCGCTPESDATFCTISGAQCGALTAPDNCGNQRMVSSCGTCSVAGQTCGGGDAGVNHCGVSCAPVHAVAALPVARATLAAATGPDGRIYAIAGQRPTNGPTSEVDAYDACANTWTPVAPLPLPLGCMAAATGKDGRIYVTGGAIPNNSIANAYVYDTATNTWAAIPPMNTPRQSHASATGPDGRIYAIGGVGANPFPVLNSVEAYNPMTNTWTTVASMPTARLQLAAVTGPDGRIYAISGNNYSCTPYAVVEAYDTVLNAWSTVAPLPGGPQDKLSAALGSDGRIYAVSGAPTGCSQGDTSAVYAYNVATNAWTPAAGIPTPRESSAAATTHGYTFMISGGAGGTPIPDCASYDPVANTW